MAVDPAQVAQVRTFNRFYTKVIGVLQSGLAGTPHSLTEARVLYELANTPTGDRGGEVDVAGLRRLLDLDAGYLSRILARLEAAGLVTREPSSDDARRRLVRLTEDGRSAFAALDAAQVAAVERLLAPVADTDGRRMLAAMGTIRRALGDSPGRPGLVLRPPEPGELGWVVARHGALYAEEYGWDARFEGMVAQIVADFAAADDQRRQAAWIAEVDGEPAGCVFCVAENETTAKLRLLLVEPSARGAGVGARLVEECLRFATRAGYRRITLWTNDVLTSARRIYERAGFRLDSEEPHHSFGRDLVGQNWSREL
ncbi:bifunctional helix-turn-helix transcriptional regulator/GNAT family N-acetyltransferase [Actinopolymorpha singaporensis]|uniref:DNA-binding transcriptional regulator, MarR family n=1 Tax=Actinopolymorpha singaporensis TaxID=117157 RepID=A0A1H1VWJ5_9ACTN|nr:helix-turn-helix domain-containing GNAT family N-acetyltransferase [Actinopolymorpha singaporensis]SDS89368.1 DNA-binding transcriptional regulator, MarR family [Actinopolymorpha singaporensis]